MKQTKYIAIYMLNYTNTHSIYDLYTYNIFRLKIVAPKETIPSIIENNTITTLLTSDNNLCEHTDNDVMKIESQKGTVVIVVLLYGIIQFHIVKHTYIIKLVIHIM